MSLQRQKVSHSLHSSACASYPLLPGSCPASRSWLLGLARTSPCQPCLQPVPHPKKVSAHSAASLCTLTLRLHPGSRSGNGGGNDNNGGPSTSSTSLTLSTLFQVLQQLQATGIITNGVPQSSSGGVNGVPQLGTTGTQGNTVTQGNPVGNSPFSTQGPQRGGSIQSLRPLPAQSSAESVSSQRLPAQAGTTGTVPVVVPQRPPERGSLRDLDSLEAATDTAVQTLRGMSAAVRSIRP